MSESNAVKSPETQPAHARVIAVQDDLVEIALTEEGIADNGRLIKNEVIYICPSRLNAKGEQERLKAEV